MFVTQSLSISFSCATRFCIPIHSFIHFHLRQKQALMGEEQKKPEEKKEEEAKKPEEGEVKKEEAPPAGGGGDEKPKEEEAGKKAAAVEEESSKDPPPPPPAPQEIILRVYMHCEGCARKVRRCLKGFDGVEEVQTDCKSHKVVVKGEKADPLKVLERVQRKSHRQVELLSPIPKPPSQEEPPKKPEEKEVAKPDEKKEQLPVITAVLCVHMHCDACAQEIRRRIQKMKGVESAEPDLKSSQVTVKGSFDPPKLIDFIYKRAGKHASIVKVEPQEKPKEEAAAAANEENKKAEGEAAGGGGGEKDAKKGDEEGKEKAEESKDGGGGEQQQTKEEAAVEGGGEVGDPKLDMRKNEFYYNYPQNHQQQQMMMMMYPPRFVQQELYAYPPQIFSDENPNACSVM